MYLFILIGFYLLARSNPDVSSWELHDIYMLHSCVCSQTPYIFFPHMAIYSTFLPSAVALSACLCCSPLLSEYLNCIVNLHLNAAVIALTSALYTWSYRYTSNAYPFLYVQFSRCNAGIISCTSLLPNFLHHLPCHYTVYWQHGKLGCT